MSEKEINIAISKSPHRERESDGRRPDYWRETGRCISCELFSVYPGVPTRRIVFDSAIDRFTVEEYDSQDYQDKKVINRREPNYWEILGLVEVGLEALTTPGFLEENISDYVSPERHLRRLIDIGTERVREGAQEMLDRVAKIKREIPHLRQS